MFTRVANKLNRLRQRSKRLSPEVMRDLVAKAPIFRGVDASIIAEISRVLQQRDYLAGAVIVRHREEPDRMYFVVSGEVKIRQKSETVILGPGSSFGEMAMLAGGGGAAGTPEVVAVGQCTLLFLEIADFRQLLKDHPELARIVVAKPQTKERQDQPGSRPLTLARSGGRLELRKPVETAQVRQSLSHGRSKTVTVEARKEHTHPPASPGRTTIQRDRMGRWGQTAANVLTRRKEDTEAEPRTLDANLLADRFAPGEMATLIIVIRLPRSVVRGKWRSTATLHRNLGPVQVIVEAQGFTVLSEPPPAFEIPENRDSAPVAFELRIEEHSRRWLHVVLVQGGRPVGELTISDFTAVGQSPSQQSATSTFRSVAEADLMLVIRAGDGRVEACSPRERASLDHVTMTGFKYPAVPFRDLLADRLRLLYDDRSDPEETARALQIVGVELAACLPADLAKLLRRADIQSVMLRHEDDFDFPLELCYLDDPVDPFFIGDRIAICRWYLGVTNLPDIITKKIRKVAFLKGSAEAYRADEALLNQLYPNRTICFERRSDVVEKLFKTSEFDLIHFTGHCREQGASSGGLELADGSSLGLMEIGQLEVERVFANAQPFVMLNACASVRPYLGLIHNGSFAHRFVTSRACAVVGTLWPIAGAVANEFAQHFYRELATNKPIGRALLNAKLALVKMGVDAANNADEVPSLRRLARQIAARSYCLFANPDLRLIA
jgi:CRP-like cAMP-binding protein